ncbi:MAG: DUF3459 domain-containing protein, partial [Acidobacteria bacterium]|nr:DUF3459 domain-containing protein [Acidobacteriota bacterium]
LRLDAVHALHDERAIHILEEFAVETDRCAAELGKPLFLIAESDLNNPRLIAPRSAGGYGLAGQWSDDFHHAVHSLLTGETDGYYADFGRLQHLEKALRDVFVYDGSFSEHRKRRHGAPVGSLDGSRFVIAIQNHDQVGNRMLGERLGALVSFEKQKLAVGLLLLSPFLPLIFMGEEHAESAPFLYFTSHSDRDLVEGVRRGRREEFSGFSWKGEPPDPQDPQTFERSKIEHSVDSEGNAAVMAELYRTLLALRREKPALRETDRRMGEVRMVGDRLDLIRRSSTGPAILVAFNFGEEPAAVDFERFRTLLDSSSAEWSPGGGSPTTGNQLAPHSFIIYEIEKGGDPG